MLDTGYLYYLLDHACRDDMIWIHAPGAPIDLGWIVGEIEIMLKARVTDVYGIIDIFTPLDSAIFHSLTAAQERLLLNYLKPKYPQGYFLSKRKHIILFVSSVGNHQRSIAAGVC